MLVRIEGNRCAMTLEIQRQCLEIAEGTFGTHEAQLHQPGSRVVDKYQQRTRRSAILEPAMLRAVDLQQFAIGFSPQPRLMKRPALLARQPEAGISHPAAHRLARYTQPITLGQLLRRQCRPEIRIALANQRHCIIANPVADPVVRRTTDCLVPDRRRTVSAHPFQKTADLARAQIKHMRRRHYRHPASNHLRQNLDPLQIALAHGDQSHLHLPDVNQIRGV